jgi:hypothetical protein
MGYDLQSLTAFQLTVAQTSASGDVDVVRRRQQQTTWTTLKVVIYIR